MGGENLVGLSRAVRAAIGVQAGDTVDVAVVLDAAQRQVDVPTELAAALSTDHHARLAFERLAPPRRKELARRIAEAKRPDTRARRVDEAIRQLHDLQ